ncbi:TPA: hypothetical protein ACGWTM_000544 [Legionella pneumophila]
MKQTDAKLQEIMEELIKREPIFHRPEFGTTRADFERMTHPQFWEIGASGKQYDREYVIDTLVERYKNNFEDIWETKDFYCFEVAPDNYLLTYTLIQNNTRITRRSTLWRLCDSGWKILYHQGTIVKE